MNEQPLTQPIPTDNPEAGEAPEAEQKLPETKLKKTVKKILEVLEKLTGSKEKSKKMFTLIIITGGLIFIALLASLFRRPESIEPEPAVEPTPMPGAALPTKAIEPEEIEIGKLKGEIDSFDTDKKDILPPDLDFVIKI